MRLKATSGNPSCIKFTKKELVNRIDLNIDLQIAICGKKLVYFLNNVNFKKLFINNL